MYLVIDTWCAWCAAVQNRSKPNRIEIFSSVCFGLSFNQSDFDLVQFEKKNLEISEPNQTCSGPPRTTIATNNYKLQ